MVDRETEMRHTEKGGRREREPRQRERKRFIWYSFSDAKTERDAFSLALGPARWAALYNIRDSLVVLVTK